MSALLKVEKEILTHNPFGSFFVGADTRHTRRVTSIGAYPARLGFISRGIAIQFEEVEGASYIQAILPPLHTLHICAEDYLDGRKTHEELFAKLGGVNIGAYQIESLGGKQSYIGGRVRIFSLEAAEEATRRARSVKIIK